MIAKPIRALELHYPMIQFLIISIIIRLVTTSTLIIFAGVRKVGYFSHASSYRENVASARRVKIPDPQVEIPAFWIPEAKICGIPKSGIRYTGKISCFRERVSLKPVDCVSRGKINFL